MFIGNFHDFQVLQCAHHNAEQLVRPVYVGESCQNGIPDHRTIDMMMNAAFQYIDDLENNLSVFF